MGMYLNLFLEVVELASYRSQLHSGQEVKAEKSPLEHFRYIIQSLIQQSYSLTGTRRCSIKGKALEYESGRLLFLGRRK